MTPPKSSGVTSHTASEPHPRENPKDERMIGFVFPGKTYEGKDPFDYIVDPKTGLHDGQPVWGVAKLDLRHGIKGAVLPPLFTWKKGRWLVDIEESLYPLSTIRTHGNSIKADKDSFWEFNIWVVSGEGTPGDFAFRCYLLADQRAKADVVPKHPLVWPAKEKAGDSSIFTSETNWRWRAKPMPSEYKNRYEESWELLTTGTIEYKVWQLGGGHLPASATPATPATPAKPATTATKAPGLPTGTRFRCGFCGHWFTEAALKGHIETVCPGRNEDSDWVIMCDDKCGCEMLDDFPTGNHQLGHKTLDHPSTCKPGFPRPKKAAAPIKPAVEGGDETGVEVVITKVDEKKKEVTA